MRSAVAVFYLLLLASPVWAESRVSDDDALHVILGAASDEGYKEMYAVAAALKNRDRAWDVPERRAYIDMIPQETKDLAMKAWRDAQEGPDPTLGANRWHNEEENGNFIRERFVPKWVKKKYFTTKIGRHRFFKIPEKPQKLLAHYFKEQNEQDLQTVITVNSFNNV